MSKINSIVLIGMPATGKSTLGSLLAQRLGYSFYDLDKVISERHNLSIQALIDKIGEESFLRLEEKTILKLPFSKSVIAPGGSLIFNEGIMKSLKDNASIIYLENSFETLEKRLKNLKNRGIVGLKNKTLREIHAERIPLYKKHATVTLNCQNKPWHILVDNLIELT